jgi:hypothetical protein
LKSQKGILQIPGVGKSIARDLKEIGILSVSDLKNKDPEKLYVRLCRKKKVIIDKCVLYVFRCAIYYSSRKKHDPELLKWWNWKGKEGSFLSHER